ncbi:MAG: DUF1553 domain-containing protein [Pirellulaceae bacterium]
MIWARNLLFIALSACGIALLGSSLLSRDRIERPDSYNPKRIEQDDFAATLERVNREFADHWRAADLKTAPKAEALTICRRISLGLTGTVPSLEEIRALEDVPPERRVEWWVSRLLEDRRYADYVGERLTRAYVGVENGPFLVYRRRRFVTWLSERLASNDPYNEIVEDLIADKGLWTTNPAVNFLTVTAKQGEGNKPDEIRLAARTARAFLGMRIDCLQCHDNNLPRDFTLGDESDPHDGMQTDFHQLAAFYCEARTALYGIGDDPRQEYKYEYLYEDEPVVVEPKTPYLSDLPLAGKTRRQQLAGWVTHEQNKPFARAMVNRVWALLAGRPLLEPVDDIPLYGYTEDDVFSVGEQTRWWSGGQPFPPGMDALAEDFASHGYDMQRLIRLIAASDVYQLDSRADFPVTTEHESKWAVFPLSRLRPEQVAGGLIQASSLTTIDANAHIVLQLARYFQENDFVERYGDTGEDEFDERGGTIPQRLLMLNGNLVQERTENNLVNNAATRIALLAPDNAKAVEAAYLAVLTRGPSPRELDHFTRNLAGSKGRDRSRRLEDLYWVLLNSTEFSWNH